VFGSCFTNAPEPGLVRSEMCVTELGYGQENVQRAMERFDTAYEQQAAVLSCSGLDGTI